VTEMRCEQSIIVFEFMKSKAGEHMTKQLRKRMLSKGNYRILLTHPRSQFSMPRS
jgi:hypothetical protein